MKRAFYLPLAALAFVACQDQQLLSPPADGPLFAISDGANMSGNPDFWFLPPVVSNPEGEPEFDRDEFNPNLMPVVRICAAGGFDDEDQCPTPGSAEHAAVLNGNHYQVNWKTSTNTVGVYRVEVVFGTLRLGFFDAQLSSKGNSAAAGNVAVKAGSTVPVKFSIENRALCWNAEEQEFNEPCVSRTVDLSQGGVVALNNGNNINIPAQQETNQVTTITVQPCEDLNPRVLDLPTFGDCLTVTANPPLEQNFDIPAIVSICTLNPADFGLSEAQEDFVTLHRLDPGPVVAALPHAVDNCDTQLGASEGDGILHFAKGVWNRLTSWASPPPLQASTAVVLDRGGGGNTGFISDFQFALPGMIVKVDGDNQVAAPGEQVEIAPEVRVIIELGNEEEEIPTVIPVPNARVTFEIGDGNGAVGSSSVDVMTDANGFAAVGFWELGDAGTNTLNAFGRGMGTEGAFVPDISQDTEDQDEVDVTLPPDAVVFTAEAVEEEGEGPSAAQPIFPVAGDAIPQNVEGIGCTLIEGEETRGLGYQIVFDWTDAAAATGIAGYQLFVKHPDAVIPIVNSFVPDQSTFTHTACNSFTSGPFLEGWEWTVQAKDNDGNFGPVSATATFDFLPCVLDDESPCRTPDN